MRIYIFFFSNMHWNVVWNTHLNLLFRWKEIVPFGVIRYVGIHLSVWKYKKYLMSFWGEWGRWLLKDLVLNWFSHQMLNFLNFLKEKYSALGQISWETCKCSRKRAFPVLKTGLVEDFYACRNSPTFKI